MLLAVRIEKAALRWRAAARLPDNVGDGGGDAGEGDGEDGGADMDTAGENARSMALLVDWVGVICGGRRRVSVLLLFCLICFPSLGLGCGGVGYYSVTALHLVRFNSTFQFVNHSSPPNPAKKQAYTAGSARS